MDSELHDEPDTWPCYRHSDRETALRCGNCERPICVDCAVAAAVGIKCPDCAKQSPAARARVPRSRLSRALAVAFVAALVAGFLHWRINVPYIGLIVAWFLGAGIGTLAKKASGGFRDPALARGTSIVTGIGFAIWPGLYLLDGGSPEFAIWSLLAAGLAGWAAWTRCE